MSRLLPKRGQPNHCPCMAEHSIWCCCISVETARENQSLRIWPVVKDAMIVANTVVPVKYRSRSVPDKAVAYALGFCIQTVTTLNIMSITITASCKISATSANSREIEALKSATVVCANSCICSSVVLRRLILLRHLSCLLAHVDRSMNASIKD
jgi:hypothetical protein